MQPQNPYDPPISTPPPTPYPPQQPPVQPQESQQYSTPQPPSYQPQVPYDRDDEDDGIPQATYYSRPIVPAALIIPADIQQKHEEHAKKYPALNLSAGEYVIAHAVRHPIGLVKIWALVVLGIGTIITSLFLFTSGITTTSDAEVSTAVGVSPALLAMIAILTIIFAVVMGAVGTSVYRGNNLYLTNESVTQNIQMTPFANRKQTVSLGNIEDASYSKPGILATIFDYGEIRLSTEGDETTYRFPYASNPDKQVALLNDAIEAFKNGRPIRHS